MALVGSEISIATIVYLLDSHLKIGRKVLSPSKDLESISHILYSLHGFITYLQTYTSAS